MRGYLHISVKFEGYICYFYNHKDFRQKNMYCHVKVHFYNHTDFRQKKYVLSRQSWGLPFHSLNSSNFTVPWEKKTQVTTNLNVAMNSI